MNWNISGKRWNSLDVSGTLAVKVSYKMIWIIQSLTEEFAKAAALINMLSDADYRKTANGTGSIGGHIRHNLDFLNGFLMGINTGKIDYNDRRRDPRIETDVPYAREMIEKACARLRILSREELRRSILVRSEMDLDEWNQSSVMRELEFVHSHTVHHHALIREKLAGNEILFQEPFGVAPSTLVYWNSNSAAS
jgi:hypothetical protein